jgi:hypothetical protein
LPVRSGKGLPAGKGALGPLAALDDAHAKRIKSVAAPRERAFNVRFVLMSTV